MALLSLIGPATKLLGKFIEDKDQKNKLAHSIATMAEKHAQELAKGQIDINKEQAKHPSIFVWSTSCNNVGMLSWFTLAILCRSYINMGCYDVVSRDGATRTRSRRFSNFSYVASRTRSHEKF